MNQPIIIAKIGSPHGVRGWVKLNCFTSPYSNVLKYLPWRVASQQGWGAIELEQHKDPCNQTQLLVKFAGVDSRDQAHALTGKDIAVERDILPHTTENNSDEVYWNDLIGCTVQTTEKINLGTISSLFETGANDVLVVKDDNDRERLIPYTKDAITHVDLSNQLITVDWDPDF